MTAHTFASVPNRAPGRHNLTCGGALAITLNIGLVSQQAFHNLHGKAAVGVVPRDVHLFLTEMYAAYPLNDIDESKCRTIRAPEHQSHLGSLWTTPWRPRQGLPKLGRAGSAVPCAARVLLVVCRAPVAQATPCHRGF